MIPLFTWVYGSQLKRSWMHLHLAVGQTAALPIRPIQWRLFNELNDRLLKSFILHPLWKPTAMASVKPELLYKNIHFPPLKEHLLASSLSRGVSGHSRVLRNRTLPGGVEHHGVCANMHTCSQSRGEPYGQSHHREVHEDTPAKLWQVLHMNCVCCNIPELSFPRGGHFCLNASASPWWRHGSLRACRQVEGRVISLSLCSCLQEKTQCRDAAGIQHTQRIKEGINTHIQGRQCNH